MCPDNERPERPERSEERWSGTTGEGQVPVGFTSLSLTGLIDSKHLLDIPERTKQPKGFYWSKPFCPGPRPEAPAFLKKPRGFNKKAADAIFHPISEDAA